MPFIYLRKSQLKKCGGSFPTGSNFIDKTLNQVVCANGEHTMNHGEGKTRCHGEEREKLS